MDISDVNLSTLSKAFKLAARTRLKVGPFWCCYFMLYYVFIFISFMYDSVVVDFFSFVYGLFHVKSYILFLTNILPKMQKS